MADVVTFGEAMVRLTAPDQGRLETSVSLDMAVGGAELNVAVALARLGVHAAWVSGLPPTGLGRLIAGEARRQGVDLSHLVWREGRAGLYFVEEGAYPRPAEVTYDREGSAVTRLRPEEVPWRRILSGAKVFHTTGITPALGGSCRGLVTEALDAAGDLGVLRSFDTNYRSRLWPSDAARACLEELLPRVDLLLTSPADLETVFGLKGEPEALAAGLRDRFGCKAVALSLRESGSAPGRLARRSLLLADRVYRPEAVEHEVVDALGSGDAFAAGLLYGWLQGDPRLAVAYGDALAALKQTLPGDFALFGVSEVEAVLASPSAGVRR